MPEASRPLLVAIDGHYYAYRFFFGMPPLTGPGGRPTGVTYAFANLVKELKADARITHLVCVFDAAGPSFRNDLFPAYKAHRDPMPEPLRIQLPDVEAVLAALHVPVLKVAGYEADDVLYPLACQGQAADLDVRLYTRDKDIDQVVSERVRTYDVIKKQERGPAELWQEKGIRPEQVVDYLCLIGDTSDNVPGVHGVGPKTAAKLLAEHGTLEAVLAAPHKGKLAENVAAFLPKTALTRRLITLVTVPDLPALATLAVDHAQPEAAPFEALGFQVARFSPAAEPKAASTEAAYERLSAATFPAYCERLARAGRFAVDTETTGLDPLSARLVGVSFACGEGDGRAAAWLPLLGPTGELEPWAQVGEPLRQLLGDPRIAKVGQNIKFDDGIFAAAGVPVAGYDGDSMLASWMLDPGRDSHDLDSLALVFLGERKIATSEVSTFILGQTMADADPALVMRYACEDAQVTWRLARLLEAKLAEHDLLKPYREQEVPVALAIGRMERAGLLVDRAALAAGEVHLTRYLAQVMVDIRRIAGADFNPSSPKQVAQVLFERLGLPVVTRTSSGPSTDASVLEALRHQHELPDLILQHRQLSKLISSYLAKLPGFINPADGRIHGHFRQTGTETGRLSSDQPNLQNIPKKSEHGREIRAAFAAAPGHVLIAADYSQIELRVLAELSGDPALRAAFAAGADIHRHVAALVNGLDPAHVTPSQRSAAKAVNFGIIYGQTAFGLASQLGIERHAAKAFIDAYFARFASVQGYIAKLVADATACGYARTLSGRRRYVPQLGSGNRNDRLHGERIVVNSTIQGSAADLIKRAMLALERTLPAGARLVLQVHDELIVESPDPVAAQAAEALVAAMRGAATFTVPLVAEARTGRTWLEVS